MVDAVLLLFFFFAFCHMIGIFTCNDIRFVCTNCCMEVFHLVLNLFVNFHCISSQCFNTENRNLGCLGLVTFVVIH